MISVPRRPEGNLGQQVEQLFDLLFMVIEEINLLEERIEKNEP